MEAQVLKKVGFGYSVKVWSQKREESPTVKRQPVYNFLKRTINNLDTEKQRVKNFTENFIHEFFLNKKSKSIRILTLPGVTWNFEKSLKKRLINHRAFRINVSITGCENDYKVFCLSAANMPVASTRTDIKLQPYYSENLKHYVLTNNKQQVYLLNADIFDIINKKNDFGLRYNVIWFDTTNTVISISKRLEGLGYILSDNSIVIFTVLKGREHIKFETNRVDYVSDKLKPFGLKLVHQKEYFDSCAMLHLIYSKTQLKMPREQTVNWCDATGDDQ